MLEESLGHNRFPEGPREPVAHGSILYRVLEAVAQQIAKRVAADNERQDPARVPVPDDYVPSADGRVEVHRSRRENTGTDRSTTTIPQGQD